MSLSILNVGNRRDEPLFRGLDYAEKGAISVQTIGDPLSAHVWASIYRPDVTLVDLRQLNGEGIRFMRRFRTMHRCKDIPLIAVINEQERNRRAEALNAGANELITAPLDRSECKLRIANVLALSEQRRLVKRRAKWLENEGGDVNLQLQAREREILRRLARAGEYRDADTGKHIERIASISRGIAEVLGLSQADCEIIEASAPMHDIGKIGVSDTILNKAGPLTPEERAAMQKHTVIGYEILKDSQSIYLQCGAEIALAHHEKFDGSGYPYGTRGYEIPLAARIVAVADVYDALTSRRAYKPGWPVAQVIEYLYNQSGKHFDPECVAALTSGFKAAAGF